MELPVISSCLDATAIAGSSLNNGKSFLYRLLTIFSGSFQFSYRYWKWGPLFFAFIYAFSNLASRINLRRLLLLHHHHQPFSSLSNPLPSHQATVVQFVQDDADSSSDEETEEEDNDACSSSCSLDEDREDSEFEQYCGRDHGSDDYKEAQAGGDQSTWRSRWGSVGEGLSELLRYNGVVKLWDESSHSEIRSNLDTKCDSILGKISVMAVPPLIVSSGVSDNRGKVMVHVWDTRVSSGRPAACGEWRTRRTTAPVAGAGVVGGVDDHKVYCVSSDMVEGFVWDMRMFHLPLIHAAGL